MKLAPILLSLAALASGCAQLLTESNGRRARIDVTNDGFARAVFSEGELIEKRRVGDCALLEVSKFLLPDPNPNSGPIRITVGNEPVVLAPQYHGLYRDAERRKYPIWAPGEPIVVTAPGATAPPFQIELSAPQPIETIEPPSQDPNERGPDIWALRDWPLKWNPVENATLVVQIFEGSADNSSDRMAGSRRIGRHRIRCEIDAKRGAAVVPQELIAEMPLGDVTIFISSMQQRIVEANDWRILVRAYTDAIRERHGVIDDQPPTGPNGEEGSSLMRRDGTSLTR